MRHQTRGLNKASRNSQDGISMLQTADAALQETQDVLGRMVELTTQAANDTHTDADRRSIQDEIDPVSYTHLDVYKRQMRFSGFANV